jgi:hypothetical protein
LVARIGALRWEAIAAADSEEVDSVAASAVADSEAADSVAAADSEAEAVGEAAAADRCDFPLAYEDCASGSPDHQTG